MRAGRTGPAVAMGCAMLLGACGLRMFDRWDGRPVLRQHVAAPADALWERLSRRASEIGLVVARILPEERAIEFDWVTAPGDGRLYLRCRTAAPIGSASLKPRVVVEPAAGGSTIVIGSIVRATTPATCESTGQFEGWLLDRLEPAILAAVEGAAADATATPKD